jgi:DNA-directed RNA polymerase specialized sigma24 family protein
MRQEFEVRLEEKLDRALLLLGMVAVKGLPQLQQIAILSRTGFSPKEIADIVGTTPNTVRVALVSIRRIEKERKRPMRFPREERSDE